MKFPPTDTTRAERTPAEQIRQRVRVGMIGLAAIVLLIGLASAIFSTVDRTQPPPPTVAPDGTAKLPEQPDAPFATPSNEPLAELGVTPAAGATPVPQDD